MVNYKDFSELTGKILVKIEGKVGDEAMVFTTSEGEEYQLVHYQDCCESVYIEDIIGDLGNLIGEPLLMAEEVSSWDEPAVNEYDESFTWTFYKLATVKGYVTIRWYGTSNGYYSESVDFCKLS